VGSDYYADYLCHDCHTTTTTTNAATAAAYGDDVWYKQT